MGDETLVLKQDIIGTVSNNNNEVVENLFRNEETLKNIVDELSEQENPDVGHNESPFSDTQEYFASDDGNKNITMLSVDSDHGRKLDLQNTGIKVSVQYSKKKNMGSANFAPNTEEFQRGRAEVIRLQAVSNNNQQSLEKSSLSNSSDVTPENSTHKVYINEDLDIITNESTISSQEKCILESTASPLKEMPVYLTQNDLQNINPNVGSDILETAVSSITENIGTTYQQIMLDVQPPEYTMLNAKKALDVSAMNGLSWATNSTSSSTTATSDCSTASNVRYQNSDVLNEYRGVENIGINSAQTMESFVTADNQVVYGYKDSNGEMHFFSPAPDDRESHNEKERRRRSRVSIACNSLRKMIPGISEKTDKATVFEQTAKYLKFLRDKFGTQFDQAYCEKYYQRRS